LDCKSQWTAGWIQCANVHRYCLKSSGVDLNRQQDIVTHSQQVYAILSMQ
jgi:hypothetical protein